MWQVKYSLLERKPEQSGLLQCCKDMNISLVAHSPLQQGLLTGEGKAHEGTSALSSKSLALFVALR